VEVIPPVPCGPGSPKSSSGCLSGVVTSCARCLAQSGLRTLSINTPRRQVIPGVFPTWSEERGGFGSEEFETCPRWGPGMDKHRQSAPMILKALHFDRFDHSASWPAKVRNVSRLGSQRLSAPTPNGCLVDSSARRLPRPYPQHSAGFPCRAFSSVGREASRGCAVNPQG
jgi:hypothetical protein